MIKGRKVLSEQDFKLLYFLWKWKMSTTAAIAAAIYANKTWYRSYVRLNELAKWKYIRSIASESGHSFIWTLDTHGYAAIQQGLPLLANAGYKSENQSHDFLVSAIHLGEWLIKTPIDCATFSEQELRRLVHEAYPIWVPITDTHRPDGYWKVACETLDNFKVIALEVELSLKSPTEYREVGVFYGKGYGIDQVIWVTKTLASAKYIQKHLGTGNEGDKSIHSFVTLDQYYEYQWQSKIIAGRDRGFTMDDLLRIRDEIHLKTNLGVFSLDGRKSPKNSTTLAHIKKHNFGGSRGYVDYEI
jgi:hypothetical protein